MRARSGYLLVTFIPLVTLAFVSVVHGDTVHTTDGSRIVGRIERMGGGKLVISTDFAGTLELDTTKIKAVAIDEPLTIAFTTGDRLVGTMTVSADQNSSVVKSELGSVSVTLDKIAAIWPVGGESPEVVALKAQVEDTRKALTPVWTTTLEAGGSSSEGNTNTLEARGRLDVKRKTDRDLLHFYLAGKYHDDHNVRTVNEYRGGVNFENHVTDKWYWFVRNELEFDEFEDLDLRATAAAGFGYYWIKKPKHEFKTRAGLGYRHEAYDTGRSENQAVIDLGIDYRLDLTPWAQFTHATTFSPDFEDSDNYRLDLDTALVFPFQDPRVKFKVGVTNEYNSRPQPGFDRLDSTYYANILLELKELDCAV